MTVVVPAKLIEITPKYAQLHLDELLSAGAFLSMTVGEPGTHGVVTGMHGVGVSTPLAAAVADAVVGFAKDEHTPNGGILAIGIQSLMLAAVSLLAVTPGINTDKVAGAAPKLHCIIAVCATSCPMCLVLYDCSA